MRGCAGGETLSPGIAELKTQPLHGMLTAFFKTALSSYPWLSLLADPPEVLGGASELTFKMKQNVRLVVLEHLGDQLNVHVLNVDLLLRSPR